MGEERLYVLTVATLASFLTPFMSSSLNVAIPAIGRDMGGTAIMLSWIASSYLLASAMFLLPFGRLADIYGRKKIFLIGVVLFGFSSFLCALSNSLEMLIGFRIIQGIGGAMIFGTGIAIITSVFPPGERGKAIGINTASVYIGLSLGPALGGFLTQRVGWRMIFIVVSSLCFIIVVIAMRGLKGEWAGGKGEEFDAFGAFLYGIALISVMGGMSLGRKGVFLVALGLIGFIVFAHREMAREYPLLELRMFRDSPTFAFSTLAALLNYSATAAVGFLISLYLQTIKGMSPQLAGIVLLIQPVIQAIFSPMAGILSDRIEPRVVASIGMGISTICLLALSLVDYGVGLRFIIGVLASLGLGFALFASPNTNAAMSAVDRSYYGVASSVIGTARLLGQTFSMAMIMAIFSVTMRGMGLSIEHGFYLFRSMKIAFSISASLCFLGIFASLARGKIHE